MPTVKLTASGKAKTGGSSLKIEAEDVKYEKDSVVVMRKATSFSPRSKIILKPEDIREVK